MQLPLAKGDAVFFNPALFHGAGTNVSARHPARRQPAPGLLPVRPGHGGGGPRPRGPRCLSGACGLGGPRACRTWRFDNAVAAAAEGYPFPTNLDRDQPVDGLAPASQADIVRDALAAGVTPEDLAALLNGYVGRRTSGRPEMSLLQDRSSWSAGRCETEAWRHEVSIAVNAPPLVHRACQDPRMTFVQMVQVSR